MRLLTMAHDAAAADFARLPTMPAEIVIKENTPAEWRQFSDQLNCVPDPMTIFLIGFSMV